MNGTLNSPTVPDRQDFLPTINNSLSHSSQWPPMVLVANTGVCTKGDEKYEVVGDVAMQSVFDAFGFPTPAPDMWSLPFVESSATEARCTPWNGRPYGDTMKRWLFIFALILGMSLRLTMAGDALAAERPGIVHPHGLSDGPSIELISLEVDNTGTSLTFTLPVNMFIKFTPGRKPIDLSSLEVTLVKSFCIDLTDRLQPYATADGIRAQGIEVPTGDHRIRVSIADVDGNTTVQDFQVKVL